MNAVAIIQARMSSTRLPGKVLMPIVGRPLLWHIVQRLKRCRELDKIVIATTRNASDDPIEAFGREQGVLVVRGSEHDVLKRFGQAARATRAGILVRITGDSPLVDPGCIDRWVRALATSGSDLLRTRHATPQIHEGICVFSRRALDYLLRTVPGDPVAREHVSSYFRHHPGGATITLVDADPRHEFSGARISIDTPADIEFIETVHRELGAAAGELDLAELVELLKRKPELLEINGHVHQKTAFEKTRRVLLRCRGERELRRGLALGRVLRDLTGTGVLLAIEAESEGFREAFPAELHGAHEEEAGWLREILERVHPDATLLIEAGQEVCAAIGNEAALALCGGVASSECIALPGDAQEAVCALMAALNSRLEVA